MMAACRSEWADVPGNAGCLRDPGDHSVCVAPANGLAAERPPDQRPGDAVAVAGFQDPRARRGKINPWLTPSGIDPNSA